MHRPDSMRSRFASGNLETASGPRIVVLCFDRLDRDLSTALDAIERSAHDVTNEALGHAQDLLSELVGMLDLGAWEHAPMLLQVYDYLLRLLAKANATKSPAMVREAARLVTELGDAFRSAATGIATPDGGVDVAASSRPAGVASLAGEVRPDRSRLSVQA